jgi:hypothetical protein
MDIKIAQQMTITELVLENQKLKLDAQREAEHHDRMVGELEKVYKERDEARGDLEFWRGLYKVLEKIIEEAKGGRDEWAAMCGRYKQERDEALMDRANGDIATMTINHYERILRERDEAREVASGLSIQEERVNEALKELSSIHQWIERNHPDGFIDSQTYFQNLERVTDSWYDRLDRLEVDTGRFEKERDEAREALKHIEEYGTEEINAAIDLRRNLAQALVDLDDMQYQRDEAREALKAFQPLTHHDCSFYKDIMGNCIICKNNETK